jgi:hypothetical protein
MIPARFPSIYFFIILMENDGIVNRYIKNRKRNVRADYRAVEIPPAFALKSFPPWPYPRPTKRKPSARPS